MVLPYFNETAFLPATLASLFAQEFKRAFRLILVDNASTDGSGDLARAIAARIPTLKPSISRNRSPGKSTPWNAALPRVQTPFVAFCDADTFYPPHYLRALRRTLRGVRRRGWSR